MPEASLTVGNWFRQPRTPTTQGARRRLCRGQRADITFIILIQITEIQLRQEIMPVNVTHTSRFTGPMLPLRFNDRLRTRLSPSASGRVRERALGPALAAAGPLAPAPYRHQREGIRQTAKTVNDTARKRPEATKPDSNGNLEMIPLQETDKYFNMQSEKKLTEHLEDERCLR